MRTTNPWYKSYRGGFQSSSGAGRKSVFPGQGESSSSGGRAGGKFLRPSKAMEESEKEVKNKPKRIPRPGGRYLTDIPNDENGLANNAKDRLTAVVQTSIRKQGDESKVHIIRFQVGRKSTNSVRQASNLYGYNKIQIHNSLSEVQTKEDRKYLSQSFGFNQKSIDFLNTPFFISVKDYDPIYNLIKWNVPEYGRMVPYGLAQEEYSNSRIRNSNSYHKIKVRIHLVKIIDDDITSASLFNKVFNASFSVKDLGTILTVYQIERKKIINKYVNSMLTYKGCRITYL